MWRLWFKKGFTLGVGLYALLEATMSFLEWVFDSEEAKEMEARFLAEHAHP